MTVAFNYKKRMNLAYGFATSGMGTGVTAFAPLFQYTRDIYGNTGFFFILACITIHLIVFGTLCSPGKLEISLQNKRKETKQSFQGFVMSYLKLLKYKGVQCIGMCLFAYGFGLFTISLHLPKYISVKGFSAVTAANLLSVSGVISVFGRLCIGTIANCRRVNPIAPFSGSMTMVAAALFAYPFISEVLVGHVVFVSVYGLFYANCFVLITPVLLQFLELENMSVAVGLTFMFCGVGAVAGPVCAGKIFKENSKRV